MMMPPKLTARGRRIDDAPGVEGSQEAADPCFAGDVTDPHLAEHRATSRECIDQCIISSGSDAFSTTVTLSRWARSRMEV